MTDTDTLKVPQRAGPPPKYIGGMPLFDLGDIDKAVRDRCMLWHRKRPMHAAFVGSMPYHYLKIALSSGWLYRAAINPEYREWLRRQIRETSLQGQMGTGS